MEATTARRTDHRTVESGYRCVVCGGWRSWDDLCCGIQAYAGLDPREYVELFWDEA
jgi:hypothetical protein